MTKETKDKINEAANGCAYMIQDLLDGLAAGDRFDVRKFEKEYRKIITDVVKYSIDCEAGTH